MERNNKFYLKKKPIKKKFLRDPILRPIEVYGTLLGVILIVIGFMESNRITWLNSLSNTSMQLSIMEIKHEYLSCLYPSGTSIKIEQAQDINYCDSLYMKSINVKKATLYLEANLDFIEDIIKYDRKYHTQEFITYYQEWYINLYKNPITLEFRTQYIEDKIIYIDLFIKNGGAYWIDYVIDIQKQEQILLYYEKIEQYLRKVFTK